MVVARLEIHQNLSIVIQLLNLRGERIGRIGIDSIGDIIVRRRGRRRGRLVGFTAHSVGIRGRKEMVVVLMMPVIHKLVGGVIVQTVRLAVLGRGGTLDGAPRLSGMDV